jgi:hypothetical protein
MLAKGLNLRKILAVYLAVVVITFAIFQVYQYLTTGKLIVSSSNSDNYIKINRVISGGSKPLSKQGQGRLSIRLKPGIYSVVIYSKSLKQGVSQQVSIKARHTVKLILNPSKNLNLLPVYGSAVTGVSASKTDLYYINASTKKLMHDDASGLTTMFPDYDFINVSWFSPGDGVLQDSRSGLYVVSGSSIRSLSLPFRPSPANNNAFDVSSDGKIYVSNGADIYVGRVNGPFHKIYSAPSSSVGLSAGKGKVGVVASKNGSSVGSLVIVMDSGQSINKEVSASQVTWSPDGKRLLVSGEGINYIFDSSLNHIGSVPTNKLGASVWKNNHELFYSEGNQLWLYDLNTTRAQQVVSMPTGVAISSAYKAGTYVYFTTANGPASQLYRVGLDGQPGNKSVNTLSVLVPVNVGACSLNYISFAKPTILVSYPRLETTPDLCISAAKGSIKYYGVNPNDFQYVAIPAANTGE